MSVAEHDGERLDDLKHDLDLYGFVVIEDLMSTADAAYLAGVLEALIDAHSTDEGPDLGLRGALNVMEPEDRDLVCRLLTHPLCLDLARHAMGQSVQIVETTALLRRPGAPAHALHCTLPAAWFPEHGFPMPQYRIVLPFSWILTDMTGETGPRLYMPFSHHSGRLPEADRVYEHVTRIESPAGSLALFNGATWHGQAANVSPDGQRVEIASGYMPSWYDPQAAGYRLVRRSVWEQMSPEMQALSPHLDES